MEDRKTKRTQAPSLTRSVGRGVLAMILCVSMLLSTAGGPVALAVEQSNNTPPPANEAVDASVAELLKNGEENYPNGAFGLANTQIQMTEGDEDQTITVVRMGDSSKKASVIFHMIDVSAKYGKDYELYVMEDGKKKILTAPKDNTSMMEKYGDQLVLKSEDELAEEADAASQADAASEADAAPQADAASEAQAVQEAADAVDAAANAAEAPAADAEQAAPETEENTIPVTDAAPGTEQVAEEANAAEAPQVAADANAEEAAPAAAEQTEDAEQQDAAAEEVLPAEEAPEDQSEAASRATDLITSETTAPADGLNSMERAQAIQNGVVDKNKSWREISDEKSAEYKEAEEVIDNGYSDLEKAIQDLGGLTYEVTFQPGETTKEIYVYVPNDNLSDGEVQAMFGLTDAVNGELSDSRDGYLNIKDDEQSEEAAYAFAKDRVSVNAGEESVTLTLKKTAGTEALTTVTVIAVDGTAVCNEVYKPYAESLVFAPGCDSKDFTIPLVKEANPEEAVTFYVGIGKEDGKADRDAGLAEVTVNPAPEPGPRAEEKSGNPLKNIFSTKSTSTLDVSAKWSGWYPNSNTYYENFSQWECHARQGCGKGPGTSYCDDVSDLRGATKVRFFYFTDWKDLGFLSIGDIYPEVGIALNGGDGEKIHSTNRAGIKSVYTENTSGNFANQALVYVEMDITDSIRQKLINNGDKGIKFYSKISLSTCAKHGNCNLTRVEADFASTTVTADDNNKDLNYYLPKTYSDYTGTNQKHGLFLGKTTFDNQTFLSGGRYDAKGGPIAKPSERTDVEWQATGEENAAGTPVTKENIMVDKYYVKVDGKLKETTLSGIPSPNYAKIYAKDIAQYAKDGKAEVLTRFKPKKVTVKFRTEDGVQFNKFSPDKDLTVNSLDSVKVTASPTQKNNAVAGFSVAVSSGSKVSLIYDAGRKDSATLDIRSITDGATVTVTALSEPLSLKVMLDPATAKTAKTNADTKAIVERAQVIYTSEDGQSSPTPGNWENVLNVPNVEVGGKYTIIGDQSSVSDKKGNLEYEYVWRNGSADTNNDGVFSAEEKKNYYGTADTEVETFRGNAYPFTIMKGGASKIYYNLESVNKNKEEADTGGQVSYEEEVLATGKRKKQFINGVTVTGFGTDTVTNDSGKNAYLLNGGSGFYLLASDMISRYGRYLLTYTYPRDDGSTLLGNMVASPGDYREMKFAADSVMKVSKLTLEAMSDKMEDSASGDYDFSGNEYQAISDTAFFYCDSERKHKISFTVESAETSLQPKQVVIRFRNKNGEELTKLRQTFTLKNSDAGKVKYEFTPDKLDGVAVGTYLTIQVIDQLNKKYPEQDTGYTMHKSLGRKDLDSTFAFGAGTVMKVVGAIAGTSGQGWSGRLDEHTANVKVADRALTDDEYTALDLEYRDAKAANKEDIMAILDEQMEEHMSGEKTVKTMTLCIGMEFDVYQDKNSEGGVDNAAKAKAKSDVALAQKTKALSDLESDPKATREQISNATRELTEAEEKANKAKETYEKAVQQKANKEETIKTVASAIKISVGYTYMITFDYDRAAKTWYFEKMMLTMKGKGEYSKDWQFATPVGVTIGLGFKVSGTLELSLIMKANAGHKYFLTDVEGKQRLDGKDDKVNFFAFISNASGDAMEYDGAAAIIPNIELHASGEFACIKVTASGSVGLNLAFFTDPKETNSGTISLSAKIGVEVAFLSASWTFHADPIKLFGGKDKSVDDILAGGDTYLYGSGDRFGMMDMPDVENRKGWQGEHPINVKALDENPDGVAEQLLQADVFAGANPKLVKINEKGDYLGVYLDADASRENEADQPAVYYTIYYSASGKWSKPILLEQDDLLDIDLNVADLGDRGIFVTWSTANKPITPDVSNVDKMNSMNLHGAFFDKSSKKFVKDGNDIKILEITKNTTGEYEDDYGEMNADVITDGNEMIIYYSKNYYEVSDKVEGEAVGDVVWPEDTFKVYRTYRFSGASGTDGALIEDYTELKDPDIAAGIQAGAGDQYDEYVQGLYGQVFLSVAPEIYVDETMDEEDNYWAEGTTPKIYAGSQVKGQIKKAESGNASIVSDGTTVSGTDDVAERTVPYVVDSDVISYNGLGIFAFTADYDNDLSTVNDRDIYFQIYDFNAGTMTHPVMVTADSVQDGNVRLYREAYTNGKQSESTMLAWLHDGVIQSMNLSDVVKNLGEPKSVTVNGRNVSYYLIDKSKDSGYVPPQYIASGNPEEDNVTSGDEESLESSEEAAKQAPEISGFDVYTDGGYTWYVWTDQNVKLNDGIDPNSTEATEAKNHTLETQLYMVRHDLKQNQMTAPVQITSETGANYEEVSVGVNADGTLRVLTKKAQSHVVDASEFNSEVKEINKDLPKSEQQDTVPESQFTPYNDVSDRKNLVSLAINPVSKAKLKNTDTMLDELKAGESLDFSFDLLNDGISTLSGLTLTGKDAAGNGVLYEMKQVQETNEDTGDVFTAQVRGDLTDTLKLTDIIGGNRMTISGCVAPAATDSDSTVTLTLTDKDGNVLDTKTVTKTFQAELAVSDLTITATPQRDVFDASYTVKNVGNKASAKQTAVLGVKTKEGKDKSLKKATIPALNPGESTTVNVDKFTLKSATYFTEADDANGGVIEKGTFYANAGEGRNEYDFIRDAADYEKKAMDKVKTIALNSDNFSAKEEDDNENIEISVEKGERGYVEVLVNKKSMMDNEKRLKGTRTILESSDPNIFQVDQEGTIHGVNEGKATLTAYVLPANSVSVATFTGTEKKDTVLQSVEEDKLASLPSGLIKKTTATVKVTPMTTVTQDGITYKLKGKKVTAIKSVSNLKTAKIPATIKIDGKSYKVTAIGKKAFKSRKKLKKVTIGKNVTSIGTSAFENCTALTAISIPKNVTSIGAKAFKGCKKLKTATIGAGVKTIGASAFENCAALTKIAVPKKVTTINAGTFKGCKKLKTATIGADVKTIGTSAFENCAALTKFTIPKKVTKVNAKAFKSCKKLSKLTIGSKVKTIGARAFMSCVKLKKVTIPKSVTSVGKKAFYADKALKTVTFKRTKAPKVGTYAFKGIAKRAVFKVPKKAKKAYKKVLKKNAGVTGKMKVKT
jgi:hypothetical protein